MKAWKVIVAAVVLVLAVTGVAAAASAPIRDGLQSAAVAAHLTAADQPVADETPGVDETVPPTSDLSVTEGDQVGPNDEGDVEQVDNGDQNNQDEQAGDVDQSDQDDQDEQAGDVDQGDQNDQGDQGATAVDHSDQGQQGDQGDQGAAPADNSDQGDQNDQGDQGQGGGDQQD